MQGNRRNRLVTIIAFTLLLGACNTAPVAPALHADFAGTWSVEWCDKNAPNLECGGFDVALVQEGERLCGDFGGALVNLRQTDEGSIVGTVVGSTAVLTAQSNRNGAVVLVRAEKEGGALRWKVVDEVVRGTKDIDVLAYDEVLTRSRAPVGRRTCASVSGRVTE